MNKGVVSVVSTLVGAVAGASMMNKKLSPKVQNAWGYSKKHLDLYVMMNEWVRVKQEGKHLKDYFIENGYKNIAIYGMSYAGETLVNELRGTEVTVKYGIDKNACNIYSDVNIFVPEDELEAVDVVVVTAISFFDEIEKELKKVLECEIVSLNDVIYAM